MGYKFRQCTTEDKVSQALTLDALDQSNLRRHSFYA
jgi:hypothetical protein